jgi:capsular exopolysaccharide synthesis family protein
MTYARLTDPGGRPVRGSEVASRIVARGREPIDRMSSTIPEFRGDAATEEARQGLLQERALPELVDALRWRWKPAFAVMLFFTLGATLYIESLPSQYDGKALVAIGPRASGNADADNVRVAAPKYVEYATAPSTVREVAPRLGEDPLTIEKAIDASVATDTGNVSIRVRLPSPERAARTANAFADAVVAFSQRDPLLMGQLVSRAIPPRDPASPPRRLLEAASLFVGGLLGILTALVLERARPRLRTWREISRVTGYPVVGRIPALRNLRNRPTAAFSEARSASAFRILRANIEPQLRERELDVIVVTSPSPGDGKTTVAALLSEAFARLGWSVLLIDADLRRPGLARMVRARAEPGLSDVLRRKAALTEAVREGWTENLRMLPTAPDGDAGDLVARNFAAVLEQAGDNYDLVLVDTPPLLRTEDARSIAIHAKGILLVVSAGTDPADVNESVLSIEALKGPLLGIVGNRFKESGLPYYY